MIMLVLYASLLFGTTFLTKIFSVNVAFAVLMISIRYIASLWIFK